MKPLVRKWALIFLLKYFSHGLKQVNFPWIFLQKLCNFYNFPCRHIEKGAKQLPLYDFSKMAPNWLHTQKSFSSIIIFQWTSKLGEFIIWSSYLFPWGFLLFGVFSLLKDELEFTPIERWFLVWLYDSSRTKGPGKLEAYPCSTSEKIGTILSKLTINRPKWTFPICSAKIIFLSNQFFPIFQI